MAGEIVTDTNIGKHNSDLKASTQRFIEGGSWKKANTVVLIPTDQSVPAKCAVSWLSLVRPPNCAMAHWLLQGMEIGEAYDKGFQAVIDHPQISKWQYVLTVEHDNMPPPGAFVDLLKCMEAYPEYDAISGLYWTKGPEGVPQIWGDINDPIVNYRPQPPKGPIQECYGIGMGFALWRIEMFKDKRLEKPWFKTTASDAGVGTQDLYFWGMARKFGHRCAVANNVRVGHHDVSSGLTW